MAIERSRTVGASFSPIAGIFLTLAIGAATRAEGPGISPSDRVREILADKCLGCHSDDPRKGGLDLTRRASALQGGENGPALVPGKAVESLLIERIEAGEMPPGRALKPEDLAAFRSWVESGATYEVEPLAARRAGPNWWSLRPIARVEVPEVRRPDWVRTPIDAFILAGLERDGLQPAPEADRATYLRRVSFDLTGLPPSPEEVRAFDNDTSPDAYEKLVDRLLASPRYGERWGRHWLDVVRFAESHGYETNNLRPDAWPYRDYVIRAFNDDTPFPRFVEEQLAGDTIEGADWLTQAATGFIVAGSHDVVGNQQPDQVLQQRVDDLDDMVATTSTAFLGLTAQCARCHDHKFDPISQKDYYGIQAAFAGVNHADRMIPVNDEGRLREAESVRVELAGVERELDETEPLARVEAGSPGRPPVDPLRNVERFEPTPARFIRFTVESTNGGAEPCIDELEVWSAGPDPRNLALGGMAFASSTYPNSPIHRLEHLNDGQVGNGRSWISAEAGKGSAGVELKEPATIDRIVWGRDREGTYRDRTAAVYRVEVAEEPGQWRVVASSKDRAAKADETPPASSGREALIRQRDDLRKRLAALGSTIKVYAGTFTQPGPTHILRRGDPTQKLDAIPPSGLSAVRPKLELPADSPEAARRVALARWIADPANPLAPRVMVNRAWHYHFGRGIVATPSDFGFNGDRPSHPELLDWLASEFLANGGRLKPIHRLMVLSATYRQSSRIDEQARALDGENRKLWRFNPRRLEAEEIRDAILATAGTLDLRMGGPGYTLWEKNTNYVVVFTPREELGADTFRRMVYQFKPRSQPDPTFGAFDCPDGGLTAPRRNISTTALQAFNLLNSRFILDQANRLADRLEAEAGPDPGSQVDRAFELAFGRCPTEAERPAAIGLVRDHGAPALARALFNANEFLHVP
ncbi:PSD1 and planctomycete cytochrome C domain-containing protein [Tundrisphaera lichenicola]|uniref:PSD1 and planctomycete cytochrome C domain-containing protein n=1 Tax=Tundrisphaera lichenicola TaxID=2029860 RepID=UPI003EB7405F